MPESTTLGDVLRRAPLRAAVRGYRRSDVNDLLDRIARAVDDGGPIEKLLAEAATLPKSQSLGYRRGDVDDLIDRLRRIEPRRSQSWAGGSELLPEGVAREDARRILRRQTGKGIYEFVDAAGVVLGQMRGREGFGKLQLDAPSGSFVIRASLGVMGKSSALVDPDGEARSPYELPDGRPLFCVRNNQLPPGKRIGKPMPVDQQTLTLCDLEGPAIQVRWMTPTNRREPGGKFHLGEAIVRSDIAPNDEILPVVAFAFAQLHTDLVPKGP